MSQVHPETGETPEEVKERLDNARDKAIEEFTQSQQKAIEALSSAAKNGDTEMVDVFGETFEVYTDIPGSLALKADRLMEKGGVDAVDGICEVLEAVSVKEDLTAEVWFAIFKEVNLGAFMDVTEKLLEPALKTMESRQESINNIDGFRQK